MLKENYKDCKRYVQENFYNVIFNKDTLKEIYIHNFFAYIHIPQN